MVQPTMPTTHQRPVPGAGRGSGMGDLPRVRGWQTVRMSGDSGLHPLSAMAGDEEVVQVADRLRLMAVHAHPDDESSKGAATTAKYVADGVRRARGLVHGR